MREMNFLSMHAYILYNILIILDLSTSDVILI